MAGTVAVGVDGSEPSITALRWALAEAALRGAAVHAVIAAEPLPDVPAASESYRAMMASRREEHIARATRRIHDAAGAAQVTVSAVTGHPTEMLVDAGASADLLVVGGRGLGGWRGALAGSVTAQLAGHVACPMVVVRSLPDVSRNRIVVGVDGPKSAAALRFAINQARLHRAEVLVVAAERSRAARSAGATAAAEDALVAASQRGIDELLQAAGDTAGVTMTSSVVPGHPVEVLAELGEQADLVVVGSRGRGGFASLMLGSVALGVLHRLSGPVAIVTGSRLDDVAAIPR